VEKVRRGLVQERQKELQAPASLVENVLSV